MFVTPPEEKKKSGKGKEDFFFTRQGNMMRLTHIMSLERKVDFGEFAS